MTGTLDVRAASREDIDGIKAVVSETLFPGALLEGMMRPFLAGDQAELWLVCVADAAVVGIAYFRTEPLTEGTWNLKALGILPKHQRTGLGTMLLSAVEEQLRGVRARLLLIDTSSGEDQGPARLFYVKQGYELVSTIKDFWAQSEDKITFAKRL